MREKEALEIAQVRFTLSDGQVIEIHRTAQIVRWFGPVIPGGFAPAQLSLDSFSAGLRRIKAKAENNSES